MGSVVIITLSSENSALMVRNCNKENSKYKSEMNTPRLLPSDFYNILQMYGWTCFRIESSKCGFHQLWNEHMRRNFVKRKTKVDRSVYHKEIIEYSFEVVWPCFYFLLQRRVEQDNGVTKIHFLTDFVAFWKGTLWASGIATLMLLGGFMAEEAGGWWLEPPFTVREQHFLTYLSKK